MGPYVTKCTLSLFVNSHSLKKPLLKNQHFYSMITNNIVFMRTQLHLRATTAHIILLVRLTQSNLLLQNKILIFASNFPRTFTLNSCNFASKSSLQSNSISYSMNKYHCVLNLVNFFRYSWKILEWTPNRWESQMNVSINTDLVQYIWYLLIIVIGLLNGISYIHFINGRLYSTQITL